MVKNHWSREKGKVYHCLLLEQMGVECYGYVRVCSGGGLHRHPWREEMASGQPCCNSWLYTAPTMSWNGFHFHFPHFENILPTIVWKIIMQFHYTWNSIKKTMAGRGGGECANNLLMKGISNRHLCELSGSILTIKSTKHWSTCGISFIMSLKTKLVFPEGITIYILKCHWSWIKAYHQSYDEDVI